jgi:hypothetical protein
MGTYISIPYVTRRSVHVEQSKPVTVQTTDVEALLKEEPKVEEPKVEEPKVEEPKVEEPKVEEPKVEEPKVEEPKVEEPKVEAKNVIVEAEELIPELLPKQLSVTIPSESEAIPNFSEKVIMPPRIPEFQGNMNSESHAIKKFNRRHRKHQQN